MVFIVLKVLFDAILAVSMLDWKLGKRLPDD